MTEDFRVLDTHSSIAQDDSFSVASLLHPSNFLTTGSAGAASVFHEQDPAVQLILGNHSFDWPDTSASWHPVFPSGEPTLQQVPESNSHIFNTPITNCWGPPSDGLLYLTSDGHITNSPLSSNIGMPGAIEQLLDSAQTNPHSSMHVTTCWGATGGQVVDSALVPSSLHSPSNPAYHHYIDEHGNFAGYMHPEELYEQQHPHEHVNGTAYPSLGPGVHCR